MLKLKKEANKYFKTNLELQMTPEEEESFQLDLQKSVGFANNILLKVTKALSVK